MSVWCFLGSAGEGNDDYELLETVPLVEGVVGTDESCEIPLHDPMLTPRHARVLTRDGAWYIGGIAAASSTLVNGVPTLPGEAVRLAPGDIVQLGEARFRFGGEPPAREGVDASDEGAVLVHADRLAERGVQLGAKILEGHKPELPGPRVDEGLVVPEWRRGLLASLVVRELAPRHLREILADETAGALERLSVSVGTPRGSETEGVRAILHVLAETKPPRLRELHLGWLRFVSHEAIARDWRAVARRIPLEGAIEDSYFRAGIPRITMLRTTAGWPAVGVATQLVENWFGQGTNRVTLSAGQAHPALLGVPRHMELSLQINGLPSGPQRRLIHGDLVEAETFAFRFEEDPQ